MIRRESQIGGVKHIYRVITLKSRSGVGDGPHLLMRWKIQVKPFNRLLRCRCSWWTFHVTQRCIRKATCLIICGISGTMINNDSGYMFNPGTIVTHGTSVGLWLPALDVNRIKAGIKESLEYRWLESMVILVCWWQWWWLVVVAVTVAQWTKEVFRQKSASRMGRKASWENLARLSSHTKTVVEHHWCLLWEHGMLLWRALTGDAKLLISHFRDEDLLHWDAGQRIF